MDLNLNGAVYYHYNKFPPRKLDLNLLVAPLVNATDAVARYDQMIKSMHNSEIFLAPLRSQEAIISSRMEGTISTMDEILKYEADHADGEEGSTNVRSEIIETYLYRRALTDTQTAMEDGYILSPSLIKGMHQKLLFWGRGASKSPGAFKTDQNFVAERRGGKVVFVPISPEKLQDGLDSLFYYIDNMGHPALLKIGVTHVEFESLHPFKDGNGRIGRMLITLMLWHLGLISEPHFFISAYLEEHKDRYIETMRNVSREGDWEGWLVFFFQAVAAQAKRNIEISESIRSLYENMKDVFSEVLKSKYSVQALDFMFTRPVFRNNVFTSKSGIPPSTAARFTRVLLQKQLLKTVEEASGRRPAFYSFEPFMEIVRV